MNGLMGRIRSLILGPESVDVDGLRERYGAPPSQYITLSNGENIRIFETREILTHSGDCLNPRPRVKIYTQLEPTREASSRGL